jgi:hypothetical protein
MVWPFKAMEALIVCGFDIRKEMVSKRVDTIKLVLIFWQ